jgi:hypothetical protein
MQDVITVQEPGTDAIPAVSTTAPSSEPPETAQRLAEEIRALWAAYADAQASAKRAKAEIKEVRERLGEKLHAMKLLLAKPGRNGAWSSFLRNQGIGKGTADPLARKHERPVGHEADTAGQPDSDSHEFDGHAAACVPSGPEPPPSVEGHAAAGQPQAEAIPSALAVGEAATSVAGQHAEPAL